MSRWSPYVDFDTPIDYSGPAVYRWRMVDGDGFPIPVSRFIGVDPEGVVTIGKARDLSRRISQFRTGLRKGAGHSEANRLYDLCQVRKTRRAISSLGLEVQYRKCKTELEAVEEERRLLNAYFRKHGELPPLNRSGGHGP